MKKITFVFTLLLFFMLNSFAQTEPDTIHIDKVFGGYRFSQGQKFLTVGQLVKIMEPNEMASRKIKKARSSNVVANVFGGAGGFMIGYPIGTQLGGGDPNWSLAAIGAGLVVVSIPFTQSFNKQAIEAVSIFNEGLKNSSIRQKTELYLTMNGYGIGFRLIF